MKRVLSFLIALCSAIMLCSCGSAQTHETGVASADFLHIGTFAAANQDTVYFLMNTNHNSLLYSDVATGDSGYLCGKAECMHNCEGCDSLLSPDLQEFAFGTEISLYDGKIYYVTEEADSVSLNCMELNGTNHKKVRELAKGANYEFPLEQGFCSDGYLIAEGITSTIQNGEEQRTLRINAYSIDGKQPDQVILEEILPSGFFANLLFAPMENGVAYMVCKKPSDVNAEQKRTSVVIREWDNSSLEVRELFSGELDRMPYEWEIFQEHAFVTSVDDNSICDINLITGEVEGSRIFGDASDNFSCVCISSGRYVGFSYPDSDTIRIRVESREGKKVLDGCYDREACDESGRAFLGITGEKLYYLGSTLDGMEESLVSVSLKTGDRLILLTTRFQ